MGRTERIRPLRTSVALARPDHIEVLRVVGDDAFSLVTRVFSREVYLRDGQVAQGLLLDDAGLIFADCILAADEGEFILLTEGPPADEIVAHLRRYSDGLDVEVTNESGDVSMVSLDGPYAWELLARLVGPEVIGLPYLTFFDFQGALCFRVGRTGEYGYLLLCASERVDALIATLEELGEPFDMGMAEREDLDLCALENWFFNIHREGLLVRDPIALQLQWRLSRRKEFVGSDALARRLAEGIEQRVTCVVSPEKITAADAVEHDGISIGTIVNADHSPLLDAWVGLAMLDLNYAHPGVPGLVIGSRPGARTVTPPVLTNRSLYVNPQVHAYASRMEDDFPPLTPT